MHLVVIGLNHKTAPVELREKLNVGDDHLSDALASLKSQPNISECVILCTCNRTEVYAYTKSREDDGQIIAWLSRYFQLSLNDFQSHLYAYAGHKAVEHLFKVSAGIDSMVLGEAQILGQVKSAYAVSCKELTTGSVFNTLFQQAIAVGKRVRTETAIGKGASSVGSAAALLAKGIFDEIEGRTILVVGAGKMSKLAISNLTSYGAGKILVANRSYDKAVDLASEYGGTPIQFEELRLGLRTADIVITSTGAETPIITRELVSESLSSKNGDPTFFIDMAVPRDVEPEVRVLDNIFLYDIDDLESVVASDVQKRHAEVSKVQRIIAEEVKIFLNWFRTLDALPVLTAVREKLDNIQTAEFKKLSEKLSNLSPDELEVINSSMRSIVSKICHQPMIQIKEYAMDEDAAPKLATICEVFGICQDNPDG